MKHVCFNMMDYMVPLQGLQWLSHRGIFSMDAMGALAPAIFGHLLLSARVSTRNGKILLSLSTRNIKILNTPLHLNCLKNCYQERAPTKNPFC